MFKLPSVRKLSLPLLVVLIVVALAIANIPRPRGVALFKASLYAPGPGQSWVCLDGQITILHTQVNDDFCDCADGSDEPGTSACANGSFNCANLGHRAEHIHSSLVNDGICDCCDCSDEWSGGAASCPNTCLERGRAQEEQRRSQADLHNRGSAKRSEFIAIGKQMRVDREARRMDLEHRRKEQEAVKAEKEELKKTAEAAEAEALEIYKEQQRERDAAAAEAARSQEDAQTMRYEAEAAFNKYDANKDGFVEVTELMIDMTLDRDRNGIVTVEEAKFFLDERDRIDLDSFHTLSWPRIKPIKMLAEGIFKPPVLENGGQEENESVETQEQTAREELEHEIE
ncbi:glucosidase 2 subunit beta-like, partial [Rhagoletis pomonella]|uniref:glucosidase 2 subunit beta-like n=1 Tax=Rhagoletis pomonella TaxID=28610 RepID=UPI00177BB384